MAGQQVLLFPPDSSPPLLLSRVIRASHPGSGSYRPWPRLVKAGGGRWCCSSPSESSGCLTGSQIAARPQSRHGSRFVFAYELRRASQSAESPPCRVRWYGSRFRPFARRFGGQLANDVCLGGRQALPACGGALPRPTTLLTSTRRRCLHPRRRHCARTSSRSVGRERAT